MVLKLKWMAVLITGEAMAREIGHSLRWSAWSTALKQLDAFRGSILPRGPTARSRGSWHFSGVYVNL